MKPNHKIKLRKTAVPKQEVFKHKDYKQLMAKHRRTVSPRLKMSIWAFLVALLFIIATLWASWQVYLELGILSIVWFQAYRSYHH